MMNKFSIITNVVVLTIALTEIANADNNSWTGFYLGANAGFVFNNAELKSQQAGFTNSNGNCDMNEDFSSFFPGIQLGYMNQLPNHVVSGLEANFSINTYQTESSSCKSINNPDVYDRFTFKNQLQSSIKARVGRAMIWHNNVILPYLTGGASFANLGLAYKNESGDYYSKNMNRTGWLLGLGVEWVFMQNWSVRAEYFYVDYGDAIKMDISSVYGLVDSNGSAELNLSANNVAFSVNYWL